MVCSSTAQYCSTRYYCTGNTAKPTISGRIYDYKSSENAIKGQRETCIPRVITLGLTKREILERLCLRRWHLGELQNLVAPVL